MRRGRPRHPELLTPREQEVLSLLREGLTNDQIASRLGISEPGARYHVSEILSKLGVSSRVEAAQWQPDSERRRAPAVFAGFALVQLAGAGVVVLLLIVGTIVYWTARGDGGVTGEVSSERPSAGDEGLAALRALADEATAEARLVIPNAELYAVFYPETSGIYTFRFHEPRGLREVGIVGPYDNDPSFPLWERFEDTRPPGSPSPEALDLDDLHHDLGSVMDAVRAHYPYFGLLTLALWTQDGEVHFLGRPAARQPGFECSGVDGPDLAATLACVITTPTP